LLPDNTDPSSGKPSRPVLRVWFAASALVWLACVGTGLWALWAYDNRPGVSADAPGRWPAATALTRPADRPTLLLLAHPQCTCTRASLEELAEILARASSHRPKTYVLFLKPLSVEAGWEQTDLWRRATALPDVTVLRDDDGVEARHFGVETSGQTMLYDDRGTLIYSGGITGSRGHAGENAGELALIALLTRGRAERRSANVFGCSLFSKADQRF
jgi:hypothetical protein